MNCTLNCSSRIARQQYRVLHSRSAQCRYEPSLSSRCIYNVKGKCTRQYTSTAQRSENFKTTKDIKASPAKEAMAAQAHPLTGFYQLMMDTQFMPSQHPAYYPPARKSVASTPAVQTTASSEEPENSATSLNPNIPDTAKPELVDSKLAQQEDLKRRASIVFGSRLTGPQRWDELNKKAEVIAGVRVPPKPEEPDTCCMSGCVNCVWDIFREDVENWAAANAQAQEALKKLDADKPSTKRKKPMTTRTKKEKGVVAEVPDTTSSDMDAGRAIVGYSMWEGYDDIPVGIRAFMETEKNIKTRRQSRGDVET